MWLDHFEELIRSISRASPLTFILAACVAGISSVFPFYDNVRGSNENEINSEIQKILRELADPDMGGDRRDQLISLLGKIYAENSVPHASPSTGSRLSKFSIAPILAKIVEYLGNRSPADSSSGRVDR
jgi:hypothetical protein